MGSVATLQVHCGRSLSALVPIAELLLRGVVDLKHKHWQESLSRMTVRGSLGQVRCTCSDI